MSAFSLFISSNTNRNIKLGEMCSAIDARMHSLKSWRFFSDEWLSMGLLNGIVCEDVLAENQLAMVAIVGNIYNRDDIGRMISQESLSTDAMTDAQLLLKAYEKLEWEILIESLQGDFSILMYDKQEAIITLVTDHFGHRPVFFSERSDGIVCASSLCQYEPFLKSKGKLDPQYILSYMRYCPAGGLPGWHTPFVEIKRVAPSHGLRIDVRNITVKTFCYWDPNSVSTHVMSVEDAIERFDSAVALATRRQIAGVDRVGISLSGGQDSSYIAHHVKRQVQSHQVPIAFNHVDEKLRPELDESRWLNDVVCAESLPLVRLRLPRGEPTAFSAGEECGAFEFPGSGIDSSFFRAFYQGVRERDVRVLMTGLGEPIYRVIGSGQSLYYDARHTIRSLDLAGFFVLMSAFRHRPLSEIFEIFRRNPRGLAFDSADHVDGQLVHGSLAMVDPTGYWSQSWKISTMQEYRYYATVRQGNETSVHWLAHDHGIEHRSPLRSMTVLATLMECPVHIFEGQSREILLRAAQNVVPASVISRPNIDIDQRLHAKGISRAASRLLVEQAPTHIEQRRIVNSDVFRSLLRKVVNGQFSGYVCRVMQATISLEMWLRSFPLVGPVEPIDSSRA